MVLISILGFCIPVRIDCLRTFLLIDLWLSRFFLFYNILVLMMLTFQTLQYPFVCVIFEYNFTDSRYLQWSWNFGFLERCITNINHGMLEVNLFHAEGVLLIGCSLTQVSNPSIQFMLYEAMLVKLRKRRAWSKKGSNGVTALEVLCQFANLHKISFDWCPIYMFSLILPLIVYYIFLLIFPYDTRYFLLEL